MHAEFSTIWQNFPTSIHKKHHFLVACQGKVLANIKRTEYVIYYSIPIIQYIVFLRLIYEENVYFHKSGMRQWRSLGRQV